MQDRKKKKKCLFYRKRINVTRVFIKIQINPLDFWRAFASRAGANVIILLYDTFRIENVFLEFF